MKKVRYILFTLLVIGNAYASMKAFQSYSKCNKCIKAIDCYPIRKDIKHLTDANKLRHS